VCGLFGAIFTKYIPLLLNKDRKDCRYSRDVSINSIRFDFGGMVVRVVSYFQQVLYCYDLNQLRFFHTGPGAVWYGSTCRRMRCRTVPQGAGSNLNFCNSLTFYTSIATKFCMHELCPKRH